MLAEIFGSIPKLGKEIRCKLPLILEAVIGMGNAVTTRSIARVSGIAERTLHRFYAKTHQWDEIRFMLYEHSVSEESEEIFGIDEVVEDKCGKSTYGMGLFFGGLYKKVVKGVAFFQISAINVQTGASYPLGLIQLIKDENDKKKNLDLKTKKADLAGRKTAAAKAGIAFEGLPKGRKKGQANVPKDATDPLDAHDSMLLRHTKGLLTRILGFFATSKRTCPKYIVGDGAFGNQHYVTVATENNLHLVSKLKHNASLKLPFVGERPKGKKGPCTIYGETIKYNTLPKKYLVDSTTKGNIRTNIYQFKAYNTTVSKKLLNIVVIQHLHLPTGDISHVVLFSTNVDLHWEKLIKYYQLRNVIEIDFRESKQYLGLRDFKNYKEKQVTNAVNIAVTSKLVSQIMQTNLQHLLGTNELSFLDVRAYYRAQLYAQNLLKLIPNPPIQLLNPHLIAKLALTEAINLKNAA